MKDFRFSLGVLHATPVVCAFLVTRARTTGTKLQSKTTNTQRAQERMGKEEEEDEEEGKDKEKQNKRNNENK